jgi:hypothetical protein
MVKRENQRMAHRRIVIGIAIALLSVGITGCAGPAGPGGLPGVWQGSFYHPGADYTSPSRADLTLRINSDSTYILKWGSRAETTGTIADQGNRVVLTDSSGTQITLVHSGDTVYGMVKDTATGRATTISLAKEESAATQVAGLSARVCHAAGGEYSHGICQPTTDQAAAWKSECEARGGVYFSAEYCEVRAGGLRPR